MYVGYHFCNTGRQSYLRKKYQSKVTQPFQITNSKKGIQRVRLCSQFVCSAAGEPGTPITMNSEQAREVLGVSQTASFEDVMRAKEKLVKELAENPDYERKLQVETAYDVLLMESMKARLTGQASVSDSIKFADVQKPPSPQKILNQTLQKLPFEVQTQDSQQLLILSGIYSVLAIWAVLQALNEPGYAAQQDSAGFQLALAGAVGVYWLKEKKRVSSLPRCLGITASGIVAGVVVGSLLEAWLRVDIVPLGSFQSPGVFIAEFGILGAWATTALLV